MNGLTSGKPLLSAEQLSNAPVRTWLSPMTGRRAPPSADLHPLTALCLACPGHGGHGPLTCEDTPISVLL